jgi:cyclic pyranopterin phosphate synthase
MPEERQQWLPREGICSYEEILRVVRVGASLGVRKLRVTGGEPLVRRGVLDFMDALAAIPGIDDLGISTNGTLLCEPDASGTSAVERLKRAGVGSVNISLDTLDRADYMETTGRDYLNKVLTGIDAALAAGIPKVKLNAVLMKGKSESALTSLIDFANDKGCLLRFIELMPVSSREMLTESNFLSVAAARKVIEAAYGPLVAERQWPSSLFPDSRPGTVHWLHRSHDESAFL